MNAEFIQNRISMLIKEKNISEYKLSLDLGKSKGYIQGITSGRALPSMQEFLNICEYFNISPCDFFSQGSSVSLDQIELNNNLKELPSDDIKLLTDLVKRLKKD